jgi:hypothetical protein
LAILVPIVSWGTSGNRSETDPKSSYPPDFSEQISDSGKVPKNPCTNVHIFPAGSRARARISAPARGFPGKSPAPVLSAGVRFSFWGPRARARAPARGFPRGRGDFPRSARPGSQIPGFSGKTPFFRVLRIPVFSCFFAFFRVFSTFLETPLFRDFPCRTSGFLISVLDFLISALPNLEFFPALAVDTLSFADFCFGFWFSRSQISDPDSGFGFPNLV